MPQLLPDFPLELYALDIERGGSWRMLYTCGYGAMFR